MRRAGYQVRVLPEEDLGWEENPPTLLEFIRRDLRWCQGNMQYWPFLLMPGLKPVSRYQLLFAILMFLGSPAWICLLLLGTALAALATRLGRSALWLAAARRRADHVVCRRRSPASSTCWRGRTRGAPSAAARGFCSAPRSKRLFFILLCPIQWCSHTMFLAGLALGRTVGWSAQVRHAHAVSLADAIARLWPQTVIGWASIGALAGRNPTALPVALLIAGGLALAVPMAVVTAAPRRRAPARRGSASANCRRKRTAPGDPAGAARRPRSDPSRMLDGLRSVARRAALAAHLLRRCAARGRAWTALRRSSCARAISCSTSAPTSATASARFAGSARGWSRSSRSRRWCRRCD